LSPLILFSKRAKVEGQRFKKKGKRAGRWKVKKKTRASLDQVATSSHPVKITGNDRKKAKIEKKNPKIGNKRAKNRPEWGFISVV
jgi:hypothetical protein